CAPMSKYQTLSTVKSCACTTKRGSVLPAMPITMPPMGGTWNWFGVPATVSDGSGTTPVPASTPVRRRITTSSGDTEVSEFTNAGAPGVYWSIRCVAMSQYQTLATSNGCEVARV